MDGSQITMTNPPNSDDWLEFYYTPGTPNTDTGGSGGVTPVGPATANNFLFADFGSSILVTSESIPFPSGTAAGDLIVILMAIGSGDLSATPSGWTLSGHDNAGSFAAGWVLSKTMTAADILAGSVTVNFTAATKGNYAVVDMSAASTLFEVDASTAGTFPSSATLTTSSGVLSTDFAIYYGANGSNNSTGGYPAVVNHGTLEQASASLNFIGRIAGSLYFASPSPAGATGIVFDYSASPGPYTYQAVAIVRV